MKIGIYQIRNKLNNDIYIGKSRNLNARKSQHKYYLRINNHHSTHLQRAFNKYGEDNFVFETLLYCEIFELERYEKLLIQKLETVYNVIVDVNSLSNKYVFSEETKSKMKKSCKNRKRSSIPYTLFWKIENSEQWLDNEFDKKLKEISILNLKTSTKNRYFFICIDCDGVIIRNSHNSTKQARCDACQDKRRLIQNRERIKNFRLRQNNGNIKNDNKK